MKLEKIKNGDDCKITFIPETEEEKLIMGSLRNHYFFGLPEKGTYPEYAGITTESHSPIKPLSNGVSKVFKYWKLVV